MVEENEHLEEKSALTKRPTPLEVVGEGVPTIEVAEGLTIPAYCANKVFTFEVNFEAFTDLFVLLFDLIDLKISNGEAGLIKPVVNEETIIFAMQNVIQFVRAKANMEISDADLLLTRRARLKKFLQERIKTE